MGFGRRVVMIEEPVTRRGQFERTEGFVIGGICPPVFRPKYSQNSVAKYNGVPLLDGAPILLLALQGAELITFQRGSC